jgi:ligand-binding SRPBCC domain-containing protein
MPQFEAKVKVSRPPAEVFDFIIRPANILLISPPETALNYIDSPEAVSEGSVVEFELGGFGPPQRITHEITDFESPSRFTETQISGPLQMWVHRHEFQACEEGTLVVDQIEFEPPGGMIGFLVTADRILESLKKNFSHRHSELKRLLEQS